MRLDSVGTLFRKQVRGANAFKLYRRAHRQPLRIALQVAVFAYVLSFSIALLFYPQWVLNAPPVAILIIWSAVLGLSALGHVENRKSKREFWKLLSSHFFLICPMCGYNLYGSSGPTVCPECGSCSNASELPDTWMFWARSQNVA